MKFVGYVLTVMTSAKGNISRGGQTLHELHINLADPVQTGRRMSSRLKYYDSGIEYIGEKYAGILVEYDFSCVCNVIVRIYSDSE